ncbi:MAG TPA: type II CAAX endopeptidase family protein, partial [Clostridia bacterium]|nr:type II CAAX endopeptidase family protein [Clostridia bacterium]
MKRFFKAVGWALLYIVVYFGVSFTIGFMISIADIIVRVIGDPEIFKNKELFTNTLTDDIKGLTNLVLILSNLASLLVFWLIYKGRKKSIFKVCETRKISLKGIGLIFLLGLSFNILVSYVLTYITKLDALEKAVKSYEDIAKSITSGNAIFTVIAVVLIAPLFEEIFFRGILFNEFKNGMPLAVAFIIQAVTFGLFHGNWIQGSYAFALALLLCLVY